MTLKQQLESQATTTAQMNINLKVLQTIGVPLPPVKNQQKVVSYLDEISNKTLSIVYNVNVGHATPRCIIPFGINAQVNIKEQIISFDYGDY